MPYFDDYCRVFRPAAAGDAWCPTAEDGVCRRPLLRASDFNGWGLGNNPEWKTVALDGSGLWSAQRRLIGFAGASGADDGQVEPRRKDATAPRAPDASTTGARRGGIGVLSSGRRQRFVTTAFDVWCATCRSCGCSLGRGRAGLVATGLRPVLRQLRRRPRLGGEPCLRRRSRTLLAGLGRADHRRAARADRHRRASCRQRHKTNGGRW